MCFTYSLLVREYVANGVQFLLQNIKKHLQKKQTTLLRRLSQKELLNLRGNLITAIMKTVFIMGVRGSRKGYGNPKRISYLSGFSFLLRLEPCGP